MVIVIELGAVNSLPEAPTINNNANMVTPYGGPVVNDDIDDDDFSVDDDSNNDNGEGNIKNDEQIAILSAMNEGMPSDLNTTMGSDHLQNDPEDVVDVCNNTLCTYYGTYDT